MAAELELISGDRRADRRYDLQLSLTFSYEQSGQAVTGAGYTINLSSGGIRFSTDAPPPVGVEIELVIDWPVLLQGICALQLVVNGTVVFTQGDWTAIQTRRLTFRTFGERSFDGLSVPEPNFSFNA